MRELNDVMERVLSSIEGAFLRNTQDKKLGTEIMRKCEFMKLTEILIST